MSKDRRSIADKQRDNIISSLEEEVDNLSRLSSEHEAKAIGLQGQVDILKYQISKIKNICNKPEKVTKLNKEESEVA